MTSSTVDMMAGPLSLTRKFMLWFFAHPPFSPYVSFSFAVDLGDARAYLDGLKARGTNVTVMQLVCAAIARTYAAFPVANAAVVAGRIVRFPRVGLVAPVDTSKSAGHSLETSLVLVEDADTLSLAALAQRLSRDVDGERKGKRRNPLLAGMIPLGERLPTFAVHGMLDVIDRIARLPIARDALRRVVPATVAVTNPGAAVPLPDGALSRGGALSIPDRILPVGSLFGIAAAQNEAVVVDGEVAVRPMLPVTYVFDHRLFDGVMAGRILAHLVDILRDPARAFGEDGVSLSAAAS